MTTIAKRTAAAEAIDDMASEHGWARHVTDYGTCYIRGEHIVIVEFSRAGAVEFWTYLLGGVLRRSRGRLATGKRADVLALLAATTGG